MTDFLLELRSEEIPARMQAKARDDLARLFSAELTRSGLTPSETQTYATPRRLALIARGLPDATEATSEELKGPRASAPPQALEGFLRKTGLARSDLTERDGILYAVTEKPGRATAQVLAEAIPAIIRAFPWPKSMRWGAASASTESLRWVRPLHGIVALFGDEVVPCEIAGVTSSAATLGHRFHHPGVITIGGASDYVEKLRACHVIVDQAERETLIRDRAKALAAEAGLELIEDEGLVAENAGLTEWPVPLLGRFDEAFLEVPPEVIRLTARVNQKYFVCVNPPRDGEGNHAKHGGGGAVTSDALNSRPPPSGAGAPATSPSRGGLANAFICTADIDAADGGAKIIDGNRKVLAARLADARFFYETDLKVSLEEQAKKLDRIVFHEKLGTVADKVDRVAKLARWLVEEGIVKPSPLQGRGLGEGQSPALRSDTAPLPSAGLRPSPSLSPDGERENLAALAERAARLCKADLVTGMVGEFPELQGLIGGYYAAAQGEDPRVAAAIRDHYKPVGQGDDVPTDPVTVAVSLADKLDTVTGFFAIDEKPTGSRDPFALRRAWIGIIRLMLANGIRWSVGDLVREARVGLIESAAKNHAIVSIADEDGFAKPVAVKPADAHLTAFGTVFVVAWEAEPQTFITSGGVGYSAYSRDYIEENDLAARKYSSLLDLVRECVQYFGDRLAEAERASGVRTDLIRSVLPRNFVAMDVVSSVTGEEPRLRGPGVYQFRHHDWSASDDPIDILTRVRALQAFIVTDDGANLLAGYKRAANILKKEGFPSPLQGRGRPSEARSGEGHVSARSDMPLSPEGEREQKALSYTPEPAEAALIAALDAAEPAAAEAVAREDFEGAMTALATLRAPIDAFFDTVTVNDPDEAKRAARLALLARVRDAVHSVADFSKIEG